MMSTTLVSTRLAQLNTLVVLFGLSSILMSGTLGCRSARDNQIDLLERELRTQEDYIYELEDYVLEYSEKLRDVRCALPSQIVTHAKPIEPELMPALQPDGHPGEQSLDELPEPEHPEPEPEAEEPQELLPEDLSPEDIDIPDLELETAEPVSQQETRRDASQVEAVFESDDELIFYQDDAVELTSTTEDLSNDEYASEAEFLEKLFEEEPAELDYRNVERLVIIGVYRGDQSEEEPTSLLTVIEARDVNEEPVDLDGKVSLMIMTADSVGPQRLKRWDFNAEETASAWQSSPLGDGLHLELPLEGRVESEEPLELWVRLVGSDGRKLLAQLPLPWEGLISVEEAMENQPILMTDDSQLAEHNAQSLSQQEVAEIHPVERDLATVEKKNSRKAGTQWRASHHQSRMNSDGYSSTAKAAKGWTSQPTGGREPHARIASGQHSTAVRQAAAAPPSKKPMWTAGRNSFGPAASQLERPQWAPPNVTR
ncbi:MAG: hypothetical protein GXP24_04290 [Planctomycetes bacterium]|nr:hypothetical protein [Planctomycetota bacterium]